MKFVLGGLAFIIAVSVIVLVIRHESQEVQKAVKKSVDEGVDTAIEKSPQIVGKTIESAGEAVGNILRPRENRQEPQPSARQKPEPSKESLDPIGIVSDVFEIGRQATRAVDDVGQDLFALDVEDERSVGREVHQMILQKHVILRSVDQQSRVERLAKPLLKFCQRQGLDYRFFIIDGPEINAFSHLGGYIYLHQGLLDFAASDVELQYVMGHEIAHVELKHCVRNLTYAAQLSKWTPETVGGVAQLAYQMIALGYSEDFEFEADEWSFRSQIRLGYSREQALSFARHYLDHVTSRGMETEQRRPESVSNAVVQEVENHFQSHPAARQRLHRLEKLPVNANNLRK